MNKLTGPLALVTPLLLSLGANVVWGVQTGSWVLIAAGLATPLLLALAVERFRAVGRLDGFLRAVQLVGMSLVALVAAAWSWVHTTSLLLEQFRAPSLLETALCVVAPLAVDGLAVLSVVALGSRVPAADVPESDTPPVSMSVNEPDADIDPPILEPDESVTKLLRETAALHAVPDRLDDLSQLTLAGLRELAAAEGLTIRGNKAEVSERIRAHRFEQEASA